MIDMVRSLPPCGGSGLKYMKHIGDIEQNMSPSVWREWIEISQNQNWKILTMSPSVWREWIEISGVYSQAISFLLSPSVWREWIEI